MNSAPTVTGKAAVPFRKEKNGGKYWRLKMKKEITNFFKDMFELSIMRAMAYVVFFMTLLNTALLILSPSWSIAILAAYILVSMIPALRWIARGKKICEMDIKEPTESGVLLNAIVWYLLMAFGIYASRSWVIDVIMFAGIVLGGFVFGTAFIKISSRKEGSAAGET